jgi:tubulin monoglycylase TTLL15
VQEFISNPLLIDGRAFDIGIYVLITSMEPLRMYRWKSDIMVRFCSEPYLPFDPTNINKFSPSENFSTIWDMPSFGTEDTLGFSTKDAFERLLFKEGLDVKHFWDQIDDAIVSITLAKTSQIRRYLAYFERKGWKNRNFELLRFDFILDEDQRLFLMEVNMSPTLAPSNPRESVTFEQLVHNTISMVGGTRRHESNTICVGNEALCPSFMSTPKAINASLMLSAPINIAVSLANCLNCQESCKDPSCELCLPCISRENILNMLWAYREHQKRGEMKRIFPTEIYLADDIMKMLSASTQFSQKWFQAKCETDEDWC